MKPYVVLDYYCDDQIVALCKTKKLAKKMVSQWPERYWMRRIKIVSKMPEWFKEIQADRHEGA